MTVPNIIANLGPDFDPNQFRTALDSGIFKDRPDLEAQARQVLLHYELQHPPSGASSALSDATSVPTPGQPRPTSTMDELKEVAKYAGGLTVGMLNPLLATNPTTLDAAKHIPIPGMGTSVGELAEYGRQIGQEFAHDFTIGIVPEAADEGTEARKRVFNAIIKPTTLIGAQIVQGYGITRALGYVTKLPAASTLLEKIPERLREIGLGVEVGGGIGALNPDANEEDTRTHSIVFGAVAGGVTGQLIAGIGKGLQFSKAVFLANTIPEADIPAIRNALRVAGADLGEGAGRYQVASALIKNMSKVSQGPGLAKATGSLLARQKYIADEVFGGAPLTTDDERLMAGIFRNNPSGLNIVTGLSQADAIDEISAKLGVNVSAIQIPRASVTIDVSPMTRNMTGKQILSKLRTDPGFVPQDHPVMVDIQSVLNSLSQRDMTPEAKLRVLGDVIGRKSYIVSSTNATATTKSTFDVLIGRPNYEYPQAEKVGNLATRISKTLKGNSKKFATNIKSDKVPESYLLPDGTAIRAGFDVGEIARKLRLQTPALDGQVDIVKALQDQGKFIRMTVGGTKEAPELNVILPRSITQEQFNGLGRSVDAMRFGKVQLSLAGEKPVVLNNPMGAQVQDEVAKLIKPVATKSAFDADVVAQFRKDGIFRGQAAILEDGTPAMVMNKDGKTLNMFDPVLGKPIQVPETKVTLLPTSLSNEFQPSNLFLNSLDDDELKSLFKLRFAISKGMATPVTDYEHLRGFANSRGFYTVKLPKGRIRLESASDGEALIFDDVQSAVEHIRQQSAPLPEVTPDEMRRWMGLDTNFGMIGGQGTPPMFGELIPPRSDILFDDMANAVGGRGQGVFSNAVPTRGLFADLDRQAGGQTELLKHFENLQQATVARHNFEAAWFDGSAPGLPKGVKPLKDIIKMAGDDPDEEGITAFLERFQEKAVHGQVEGTLSANQKKAAEELHKWYDALFSSFGIEAEYQFKYVPHWRATAGKFGSQPAGIWAGLGNDPQTLPNAAKFLADYYRDGSLDIYDTHAFRVAMRYLRAGSNQRFTSQAWRDAKEYAVLLNSDDRTKAYVEPFKAFLLALKGGEFGYQKKMVGETLKTVLDKLPGTGEIDEEGIDKLTNYLLGISYSSVLGMRPALALRNALQPLLMTWPLVGGGRQGFWEAVGRAMTREGRAQAILDRAIDIKGTSFANYTEAQAALPKMLQDANNAGMYLYDQADQFTRSVSYWAGRLRAEKALADFAAAAKKPGLAEDAAKALKDKLILDSGMAIQEPALVTEFLRRAAVDPSAAAGFAGKQMSDVTNFLYGRGMQARWMRSIPGRFLGQFGSWSMWYIDYIRRVTGNLVRNGQKGAAAKFLGRHALVNAAVLVGGYEALHMDLSRWVAYSSVFYSGGPALQLVAGASTLTRGLGSKATFSDDKLADSRVKEGASMIEQLLPNAVPFYYAGRDAIRIAQAQDPMDRMAAVLGTRTTDRYKQDRAMRVIMGDDGSEPFETGSPDLTNMLNELARGNPEGRVLSLPEIAQMLNGGAQRPPVAAQPGQQAPPATAPQLAPVSPPAPPAPIVAPGESKPIKNF